MRQKRRDLGNEGGGAGGFEDGERGEDYSMRSIAQSPNNIKGGGVEFDSE